MRLSTWVLEEAWRLNSADKLTQGLVDKLLNIGVSLCRVRITLRILHPQVTGFSYTWQAESNQVEEYQPPHELMQSETYRDSPYWALFEEGAGAIRRRLIGSDAQLDYPLLNELAATGASDYVALPIVFMDGSIHAITLAVDNSEGFSTEQLTMIYEMLPALSRLMEIHALRSTSRVILETYLGEKTGQQVLEGRIKRGDGEQIDAVIWFCDLRESTEIAERMGLVAFIDHLNCFFEVMAESVLEEGGEVLRYIGDAMLAIFPIGSRDCSHKGALAAQHAAKAASNAIQKMGVCKAGLAPAFGIGLHAGTVMYGNIGSPGRLEFTAIGTAANEASRIEGLTKELGVPLLVSQQFVELHGGSWDKAGMFRLRGLSSERPLFIPGGVTWLQKGLT